MRNILTIYSFPGKLLAELWFLWSKKGQLWGSARRRHHPFVHFFYATVMYSIAALIITAALSEKMPRDQHQAFASEVSSETPSNSSAEIELASPIEENDAEEPDQNEVLAEVDDAKSENKSENPAYGVPSEITAAMATAFKTGEPVRWETGGAKGYAVPSVAETSTGCRTVHYSDDSKLGWTSPPETICP